MKEYNISVLGPQYSEPRMYISFLETEFNVLAKIIHIKEDSIDRMLQAEIVIGNNKYVFSSPLHAMWDYEGTYEILLQKCDGVIYVLNTRKDLDYINEKDFQIFSNLYNRMGLQLPIITLFNDICCGKFVGEYSEYSELLKYVQLNSPVFETQIAYFSSEQCNKKALDSLKCLVQMITLKN